MKISLRDPVDDDLAIFFEHQLEPEAVAMAAFPAREKDAFFTHWREKVLPNPRNAKKTIVVDDQEIAGNIVAWTQGQQRLVGFWLGKAHWGRGIASAALEQFVRSYETQRPLHALVVTQNVGSIRVLEKCGFRRVATETPLRGPDGVEEHLFCLE